MSHSESVPRDSDLSRLEKIALGVNVGAALISVVSVVCFLGCILPHIVRRVVKPLTAFYLILLFWDGVVGVCATINISWIRRGQVVAGNFCVAEAFCEQLSDTGTAMSIMAMCYCILHAHVFQFTRALGTRDILLGILAMLVIQAIDIATPNAILGPHKYYGVAGPWCWISDAYLPAKIVTEYLFFWIAFLVSLFTFVAFASMAHLRGGFLWIAFQTRHQGLVRLGFIAIDAARDPGPTRGSSLGVQTQKYKIHIMFLVQYFIRRDALALRIFPQRSQPVISQPDDARPDDAQPVVPQPNDTHRKLILYPLFYLILILPLSIVRFIRFTNQPISKVADTFVGAWYNLMGCVDVILYFVTEASFGIFDDRV